MKKGKSIITRDGRQLARALGLPSSYGTHWELRNRLVSKVVEAVTKQELTHAEVARRVKTSRTRITAILNRNIDDVSTDLLLRIVTTLGYRVTVSICREKLAA